MSTDVQQPPYPRLPLPCDSLKAGLAWSIPAALIVGIWIIGVLGANATGFTTKYSFFGVLRAIAANFPHVLIPDEFGVLLHFSPVAAALSWLLWLIPNRTHSQIIWGIVVGLVIPTNAYLLTLPLGLVFGPFGMLICIFGVTTGEEWQDGWVAFGGAASWMWLMLALLLAALLGGNRDQERIRRGLCPKCAYDLRGTPSEACPECGAEVTPNPPIR